MHILIVDDYEMNIEILEAYLARSDLDYELYRASDGKTALAIVAEQPIDIVLLDVMLPDISGVEVCRKIKRDKPQLPVILITALKDRKSLLQGLEAEADDYLTKPIDGNEFLLRTRNLLALRRLYLEREASYAKLRQELELAQHLQQSFLPQQLPSPAGLQLSAVYRPCSYVGGDFYDFLPTDEGLGIFIADVKGKGVASAMVTATLKDNIYRLRDVWGDTAALMGGLNRALFDFFSHGMDDYFVTALYVVVDGATAQLSYVNAGHCPPLLVGDELCELTKAKGLPLGIFDDSVYQAQSLDFPTDSELFCYTDGIFALPLFGGDWHKLLGVKELLDAQFSHPTPLAYALFKQELAQHLHEQEWADDVNYIILQNKGVISHG